MLGQFGMAIHQKWVTEATMDVLDKPLVAIFRKPGWACLPLSTRYFCELRRSSSSSLYQRIATNLAIVILLLVLLTISAF